MAPPLNQEQQELIKDLYYNKKFFYGRDKLWKYIRTNHPEMKISRRQVMNYLYQQENYQLNKQPPPQRSTKPIVAGKPNYIQIDLVDVNGTFVLTAIDIFTKYADAIILKNKKETTTYRAFLKIKARFKGDMTVVQSDRGSEFNLIEAERDNLNIKYIRSKAYTPTSQSVIERFHGTLKRQIFKNNSGNWRILLPKFLESYNNSFHSAVEKTPIEVYDSIEETKNILESKRLKNPQIEKDDLKVGDRVRVVLKKGALDKKSVNTYTKEIYTIYKIYKSTKPYSLNQYKLKDSDEDLIRGTYNVSNLQKINVD